MAIGIGGLDDQRRLRFETRARRIVAADDLADTLRRADLTGVAQATPRGPEGPAIVRGYRLA